jgi:hypothetical protein
MSDAEADGHGRPQGGRRAGECGRDARTGDPEAVRVGVHLGQEERVPADDVLDGCARPSEEIPPQHLSVPVSRPAA